jgi:phage terminase large subunit-like protein
VTRGEKVIAFIERYCLIPEGGQVGRPIKLVEFQKRFILEVYDNPAGTRRAYLAVARKNGKSALIACILLAHLVGPEAVLNSQLVSGARSRDQAALVFNLAAKMIQLSDELRKIVRIVPSGKRLIGLPMNTEYKALAAEGTTAHGLSPVLAILDEVGQVKGPQDDFIDAITTAQGAHDNPLLIAISTQAPTDADLFSIWLDDAERSGDEAIVSHVYAAPDDCELDDEAAWKAANPALGLFRSRRDVEEQAAQAARMPSAENTFRVLTLNQRRNMVAAFVSASVWKAGNRPPVEGIFHRVPNFGGVDLSATTDLTSMILTAREDEELSVDAHFWMPELMVQEAAKRDRAPYDVWVREGLIRTTPGKVIDYAFVAKDMLEIIGNRPLGKIGFDRWRMDRLISELVKLGAELPLEPFGQGYVSMSPALDALEADLLLERIRHGGHPVLAMCAANAVAVKDPAGNRKLDKSKATGRIDGMVALAMSEGVEAMMQEAPAISPWDDPAFSLVGGGA